MPQMIESNVASGECRLSDVSSEDKTNRSAEDRMLEASMQ